MSDKKIKFISKKENNVGLDENIYKDQDYDFSVYYDNNGNPAFAIERTLDDIAPNHKIIVDAEKGEQNLQNPEVKWEEILEKRYSIDINEIWPKIENKFQKIDPEYEGLNLYAELIRNPDSNEIKEAFEINREKQSLDNALEREQEELLELNRASNTIETSNKTLKRTQKSFSNLKARLKGYKEDEKNDPESVDQEKKQRTIDSFNKYKEKLKRTKRRIRRAERREVKAREELALTRAIIEIIKKGRSQKYKDNPNIQTKDNADSNNITQKTSNNVIHEKELSNQSPALSTNNDISKDKKQKEEDMPFVNKTDNNISKTKNTNAKNVNKEQQKPKKKSPIHEKRNLIILAIIALLILIIAITGYVLTKENKPQQQPVEKEVETNNEASLPDEENVDIQDIEENEELLNQEEEVEEGEGEIIPENEIIENDTNLYEEETLTGVEQIEEEPELELTFEEILIYDSQSGEAYNAIIYSDNAVYDETGEIYVGDLIEETGFIVRNGVNIASIYPIEKEIEEIPVLEENIKEETKDVPVVDNEYTETIEEQPAPAETYDLTIEEEIVEDNYDMDIEEDTELGINEEDEKAIENQQDVTELSTKEQGQEEEALLEEELTDSQNTDSQENDYDLSLETEEKQDVVEEIEESEELRKSEESEEMDNKADSVKETTEKVNLEEKYNTIPISETEILPSDDALTQARKNYLKYVIGSMKDPFYDDVLAEFAIMFEASNTQERKDTWTIIKNMNQKWNRFRIESYIYYYKRDGVIKNAIKRNKEKLNTFYEDEEFMKHYIKEYNKMYNNITKNFCLKNAQEAADLCNNMKKYTHKKGYPDKKAELLDKAYMFIQNNKLSKTYNLENERFSGILTYFDNIVSNIGTEENIYTAKNEEEFIAETNNANESFEADTENEDIPEIAEKSNTEEIIISEDDTYIGENVYIEEPASDLSQEENDVSQEEIVSPQQAPQEQSYVYEENDPANEANDITSEINTYNEDIAPTETEDVTTAANEEREDNNYYLSDKNYEKQEVEEDYETEITIEEQEEILPKTLASETENYNNNYEDIEEINEIEKGYVSVEPISDENINNTPDYNNIPNEPMIVTENNSNPNNYYEAPENLDANYQAKDNNDAEYANTDFDLDLSMEELESENEENYNEIEEETEETASINNPPKAKIDHFEAMIDNLGEQTIK